MRENIIIFLCSLGIALENNVGKFYDVFQIEEHDSPHMSHSLENHDYQMREWHENERASERNYNNQRVGASVQEDEGASAFQHGPVQLPFDPLQLGIELSIIRLISMGIHVKMRKPSPKDDFDYERRP